MQVWKEIKGYEGLYEVSNDGCVRSLEKRVPFMGSFTTKRARMMRGRKLGGYLIVVLCKNAVKKTHLVHRLVAAAFINNPDNKKTVNHIDCNPLNNHYSNLEWTTQHENIMHSVGLNRHCHGETHGCSKLTAEQVLEIRTQAKGILALADKYGVTYSAIKRARSGKTWKHLTA